MKKLSHNRRDGDSGGPDQTTQHTTSTSESVVIDQSATPFSGAADDTDSSTVSRRTMLGVCTTAVAGLGAIGLTSLTRPARARVYVELADESVTLGPDEMVQGVTLSGTVEATYSVSDSTADNAVITVGVGDTAGEGIAGGYEDYSYEDLDPDSGDITQDVEMTFSVPPEVSDPDPGSAIETEFFVDVYFWLADADDSMIAEVVDSDTATLRFERQAEESINSDGTAPPDLHVGGSFAFTVHSE